MINWARALGLSVAVVVASLAADRGHASASQTSSAVTCEDAEVLSGKLLSDVCWDCMFPMRIGGAVTGDASKIPDEAVNKNVCGCKDKAGVYHPGIVKQHWEPARLIELVRNPGCSPSLGGAELNVGDELMIGTQGEGGNSSASSTAFYNFHYFAFPLMSMLDMATNAGCQVDGYVDMDMMYMSELDPTWNESELAYYSQPEAALFANAASVAACSADAAAAAAGQPINEMFWCAGSWGTLYPFSGHTVAGGRLEDTSLAATRAIAALHRRLLAHETMGGDAMCNYGFELFIPKSQYKMSMFYPEAEAKSAHQIGESVKKWGSGKAVPGTSGAVYMLWRWKDCCMTYEGG